MVSVGFIGLGSMGNPMCLYILKASFPLTVFDSDRKAVERMVAAGAVSAESPQEVGRTADVILVMVPTDNDVLDVITGEHGIMRGAANGTVVAICSTTTPETCLTAANKTESFGLHIVDAPVARGVRGAEAGDLTVFAGGEAEHVMKCRPVFDAFSGHVFHMGPLGNGQVTKTVNNLIHWVEVVGIYEALTLGAAHGLHPNKLRQALLAGSVDSRTLRELHLIGLAWPHKDMQVAAKMAAKTHTPMPLIDHVGELVIKMHKEQLRALFSGDEKE